MNQSGRVGMTLSNQQSSANPNSSSWKLPNAEGSTAVNWGGSSAIERQQQEGSRRSGGGGPPGFGQFGAFGGGGFGGLNVPLSFGSNVMNNNNVDDADDLLWAGVSSSLDSLIGAADDAPITSNSISETTKEGDSTWK